MKNLNTKFTRVFIWAALGASLLAGASAGAVTFSVSPSATSNTYVGYFTMQVGGLTNGEPVILEHYADVNTNGVLDGPDMLLERFQITDGQRALIGGATNINIPADWTGTDGAITTYLPQITARPQAPSGPQLLRLVSPGGRFSPLTNIVTITNWPYPQRISGTVSSGGSKLGYVGVVVLTASPDGKGNFVAEVIADSTGQYSVPLPVGDYQILAFRPGYVFSAATGPMVSLTAGANLTADLSLTPATQVISGRAVDSVNTNQPLCGLFMVFQSASGLLTVSTTDTNGWFTAPTRPDGWKVSADDTGLAPLGYVKMSGGFRISTTGGSVSNALLTFVKGTAMFYGTIRNATNGPMPGVSFYANDNSNTYQSSGWSDLFGNYSVVTTPGLWWLGADGGLLPTNSIVGGSEQVAISAGQAVRADMLVVPATTTLRGTVRDAQGQPVFGLDVWANAQVNGVSFGSNVATDTNGTFVINAFPGNWQIGLSCYGGSGLGTFGYDCNVPNQYVTIPPNDPTVNFIVFPLGTPQLEAPIFAGPGVLSLMLHGQPGTNYIVQVSTDLANPTNWSTLQTLTLPGNATTIWDTHATNRARFYRARIWH